MGAPVTKCASVRNLDNQVWYHNTNNQGEGLCNQGEVFPISCFKWKNPEEGFKLKKNPGEGFVLGEGFSNCYTGIWYKCDFCTYQNKDKRNTESHQCTHMSGNEKYSCIHCAKKFKFNTQYRRHIVSGCELPVPKPPRSESPEF